MKGHRLSQSLDVYAHHRVSRGQSGLKEAVMAGPRSPENTGFFVVVFVVVVFLNPPTCGDSSRRIHTQEHSASANGKTEP